MVPQHQIKLLHPVLSNHIKSLYIWPLKCPTFLSVTTCRNLTFFKSDVITPIKLSLIWYMGKNYNSCEIPQHHGFTSFEGFNPFCIFYYDLDTSWVINNLPRHHPLFLRATPECLTPGRYSTIWCDVLLNKHINLTILQKPITRWVLTTSFGKNWP